MKRTLTFCFFAFLSLQLTAQTGLNNLGFENWSENNPLGNPQPNGFASVGQTENTSNPMEGSSALKITTSEVNTPQGLDTLGQSILGEFSGGSIVVGTDISFCPDSITGYLKYDLPSNDTSIVYSEVWPAGGSPSAATSILGNGGTQSSWTKFKIEFNPMDCGGSTPDSITIIMTSETVGLFQSDIGTQTPGGVAQFDGLQIWDNGQPQDIEELAQDPAEFGVHPNPASQNVRFEFSDRAERIKIFDMTGRTVRTVEVAQATEQKQVQVNELDRGMYLYRVEDQNGRQLYSDKLQIVR